MIDLAAIAARLAIADLKARYCRCLDLKDWRGYAAVFTEDCLLDTRPSGGTLVEGRDAALAMVRAAIGEAVTAHQVHAPEIAIRGDEADGVWAMQDRVVWPEHARRGGLAGLTGYGHYHEHYVRSAGEWRIARSVLTRLHIDVQTDPAASA